MQPIIHEKIPILFFLTLSFHLFSVQFEGMGNLSAEEFLYARLQKEFREQISQKTSEELNEWLSSLAEHASFFYPKEYFGPKRLRYDASTTVHLMPLTALHLRWWALHGNGSGVSDIRIISEGLAELSYPLAPQNLSIHG